MQFYHYPPGHPIFSLGKISSALENSAKGVLLKKYRTRPSIMRYKSLSVAAATNIDDRSLSQSVDLNVSIAHMIDIYGRKIPHILTIQKQSPFQLALSRAFHRTAAIIDASSGFMLFYCPKLLKERKRIKCKLGCDRVMWEHKAFYLQNMQ